MSLPVFFVEISTQKVQKAVIPLHLFQLKAAPLSQPLQDPRKELFLLIHLLQLGYPQEAQRIPW